MSRLEGSWTDGVVADGRVLWYHEMPPCGMRSPPPHELLPSDCTLRPDVAVRCCCRLQAAGCRLQAARCASRCSRPRQALKSGNYAEANRLKDVIEGEKRAEKALRERASKQRPGA